MLFPQPQKAGPVTENVGLCFRNLDGHEVLLHMLALTDRVPKHIHQNTQNTYKCKMAKNYFYLGEEKPTKSKNLNAHSTSVVLVLP